MTLKDDVLITATLLRRFEVEAELEGGDGRHYALLRKENGDLLAHHPYSPSLAPDQIMWAASMLKLLNKELHHDGAWVIVFTHPVQPDGFSAIDAVPKHWDYNRFALLWLDVDGDVQIPLEWTKGEGDMYEFADVMLAGPHAWGEMCENAWKTWRSLMIDALDVQQGQTFKRAQGQRPSSAVH